MGLRAIMWVTTIVGKHRSDILVHNPTLVGYLKSWSDCECDYIAMRMCLQKSRMRVLLRDPPHAQYIVPHVMIMLYTVTCTCKFSPLPLSYQYVA